MITAHKRSRKNIILKMIFFLVAILSVFITYTYVYADNVYFIFGVCLLIELSVYLYINKKIMGNLLNYSAIFIVILFMFHFGQVILLAFFKQKIIKYEMRIVLTLFNDMDSLSALKMMNIAFVTLSLGTLITYSYNHSFKNTSHLKLINPETKKKIALLIILFTFPLKVFIDSLFLYKSFTQGFTSASYWLQAFPNYLRTIGNISLIGFAFLIFSYNNNHKRQLEIFAFISCYLIVLMLSGWRSENVAYLVVIAFIYIKCRDKKVKMSKILIYGFLLYIFLGILYTIVSVRFSDDRTLNSYIDFFVRVMSGDKNVLLESLREFGNTGYTTISVIKLWLNNYSPSYGKSYFFGISAIFPNIMGLPGRLTSESVFTLNLQKFNMILPAYQNIGGSILGEAFFNFGIYGGLIFSYFIGLFIGWVNICVDKNIQKNNSVSIIYFIPIMFGTLYWIRDAFGSIIRDIVWGIAFSYLLITFINYSNKKYKRINI